MMNEENMMDDYEATQTKLSKSAFSGMSDDGSSKPKTNTTRVLARAYEIHSTGRVRFDLWKPSLERRIGFRFEKGKLYNLKGTIGELGSFESRHLAGESLHVYVFASSGSSELAPGRRYELTIEISEKRTLDVVEGSRGPCAWMSRPVLRGFGVNCEDQTIIELRLKNQDKGYERKAFVRYTPSLRNVQLPVRKAGLQVGDSVEVVGARPYGIPDFVKDFDNHKEGPTGKVELDVERGRIGFRVTNQRIEAARAWLDARGMNVALNLEFGHGMRGIRIDFDGLRVRSRMNDSSQISEIRGDTDAILVRYHRTSSRVYTARFSNPDMTEEDQAPSIFAGGIEVVSRPIGLNGVILFNAADNLREELRKSLNSTLTADQYRTTRGDIAEQLILQVTPAIGLDILANHPYDKSGGVGCRRPGPDYLARNRDDGEQAFIEVKWWENSSAALNQAREQVRATLLKSTEGIKSAYIMILNWKLTRRGRIFIERVSV